MFDIMCDCEDCAKLRILEDEEQGLDRGASVVKPTIAIVNTTPERSPFIEFFRKMARRDGR
jgi:hypothetical protein